MKNQILEALWNSKDKIAKEHGYDVAKLVHTLKTKEKEEKSKIVNLSKPIRKAS